MAVMAKKEEGGGGVDDLDDPAEGVLDELRRVGHVDQVGGHAAEHAARPLGIFARGFAHVVDILGHAVVLHDVVLGQHLAAELRGEVDCAHHEEEREGRRCRQQPAYDRFRRFHISSRYPVAGDRAGSGRKPRAVRIPPGRTLSE